MKTTSAAPRAIPVSDFKAHCTEHLRAVESGQPPIDITRHGKVIARLMKPEDDLAEPMTLADWIGGGAGTVTFSPDYDPHAPAFDEDEWEMNQD